MYYANSNGFIGFEHQEHWSVNKISMGFQNSFMYTFTGILEYRFANSN